MNRRELATSIATRLRILSALERFAARPALAVLVYHRVMRTEGWPYDTDVIEATPEMFDEQMGMLRKRHAVVDPEEMVDLITRPKTIKRFHVAVTFDDGYLDNYSFAFPILKSHGLKASFFIPTEFVGTKKLPWWDRIAYGVKNTTRRTLSITHPTSASIEVDQKNPERTTRAILRMVKDQTEDDIEALLKGVGEACGVELPAEAPDRQFLSWEEASEMQKAGMAIGSHTNSHRILAQLPFAEQKHECDDSRDRLKKQDLVADCLAYPVGNVTSFDATSKECAEAAGYRSAFSNYGGINLPDAMSTFDVKRIGMDLGEDMKRLRARLALAAAARRQVW